MPKAVIFDYDGTLFDLYIGWESAQLTVAEAIIKRYNLEMRPTVLARKIKKIIEEFHRIREYNRDKWWKRLFSELGLDPETNFIRELTTKYWETLIKSGRVYDDAVPALTSLQQKYLLGLMTDTDGTPGLKHMRIIRSGLHDFFRAIVVAGEDTANVKPHPEPFLLVAKRLGVKPSEAVYVGDNPVTDAGCKAVGMRFILIIRWHNKNVDKSKADAVIGNLNKLEGVLASL